VILKINVTVDVGKGDLYLYLSTVKYLILAKTDGNKCVCPIAGTSNTSHAFLISCL